MRTHLGVKVDFSIREYVVSGGQLLIDTTEGGTDKSHKLPLSKGNDDKTWFLHSDDQGKSATFKLLEDGKKGCLSIGDHTKAPLSQEVTTSWEGFDGVRKTVDKALYILPGNMANIVEAVVETINLFKREGVRLYRLKEYYKEVSQGQRKARISYDRVLLGTLILRIGNDGAGNPVPVGFETEGMLEEGSGLRDVDAGTVRGWLVGSDYKTSPCYVENKAIFDRGVTRTVEKTVEQKVKREVKRVEQQVRKAFKKFRF